MDPKKRKDWSGWAAAILLIVLGVGIMAALPGYDFTALIAFGIAGLVICLQLLRHLAVRYPRWARGLFLILSGFLGIGLLAAVFTGIVVARAASGQAAECDYVVVLGAGVNGTVPSLSLQERLDAAYDYLSAHPDAICVVSGGRGSGEDISEAQCMYQNLTDRGIQSERVWMEPYASDTRENLRFSLDLIEKRTGTRPTEIGLVSSEYHLFRAGRFASEEQVKAWGIPARTGMVTLRINYYLREIAAVWYYTIFGG